MQHISLFSEAIKRFKLNHFEKVEIEMYHEVWYAGQNANKIEGEEGGDHNGGYDDETGCYIQVSSDKNFHTQLINLL